ncbi:MogA/MoaB family molybdenum cofactor biosynthesis protein [Trueperella pecoris]|uniref:MogA/MoaB family molybdenum cofactor biosynthesis protein n=1 Tax=Trueperella pecoris TaxID=2733571 RepID=A0A7M1QVQ4_9ACTO|nr:MogA/MoaB family molybdenum cofactor biosynthesis protein [Trueperella pecoris]QOR45574.1 MogA/MoaB family molybdenum cofactor biosynthesis protein [Trueperella pecoris]QTG75417.1 MogA/MoaB family molybdenum cofactor biosynthesis protein [Trueperella pecoris]
MSIKAAVITISDRSAEGLREDTSGPTAVRLLEEAGVKVIETAIVHDDVRAIAESVQTLAYDEVDLVITTGGTGISPQDYTARAMDPLLRFDIPGIPEAIRYQGIKKGVPGAILSRSRAGVMVLGRNRTLVINLPGSVGAVKDGMEVVIPLLDHAIDQMRGGDHVA